MKGQVLVCVFPEGSYSWQPHGGGPSDEEKVTHGGHKYRQYIYLEEYQQRNEQGIQVGFDQQYFIPLEDWNQMEEDIKGALLPKILSTEKTAQLVKHLKS